jgi:MATE family multidrug resistance protein
VYVVLRRYLQAMHVVQPLMYALVIANLVNVFVNWLLIEGHLGFPALGVVGAAYATVFSRLTVAVSLAVVVLQRERRNPSGLHGVGFRWDPSRVWEIFRLGMPAAGQILLEVGVFAAASALAGRIAPAAVAAHQIVLNVVGFIFMIPYGLGSAAAVRVGNAVGRRDANGARTSGSMALVLSTATMTVSALMYAFIPYWLMRPFTTDAEVVRIGIGLFLVAAVFQLFDGLQTVTTGALRGLGNTKTPMLANLIGHWLIGLPLAYVLCFKSGLGAQGLWIGLAAGLILIGSVLLAVWYRQSRELLLPAEG